MTTNPMSGVRLVKYFPDRLSNLGWCLWSAGMLAAYDRTIVRDMPRYIAPAEASRLRRMALQPICEAISDCLPQVIEWRLEGPPDAVARALAHLQSIGVAEVLP